MLEHDGTKTIFMIAECLINLLKISLGEMVSYLPIPGGHIALAERFFDPGARIATRAPKFKVLKDDQRSASRWDGTIGA